jgi:hypothetical protein
MPYQETAIPAALANKPRTQNDGNVLYSLKNSYRLGRVQVTAPGVCTWTPDTDENIPAGDNTYYLFAVVVFPMGGSDLNLTISGNKGGSGLVNGYVTVLGTAIYDDTFIVTGTDGWNSISGVTCTGGTANDLVDIWAIPDIDQFTELAYVRSWETPRGDHIVPVPDKYDSQATTVRIRREPTISISKDYVNPDVLGIIRGREVTIIIEIHPDGLAVVQTYLIMTKAAASNDVNAPDAAMIQSVAAGSARRILSYEPSG